MAEAGRRVTAHRPAEPGDAGASNGTANGRPGSEAASSGYRQNLVCVVAGTPTSHAAELLGSAGFETFLGQVADNYDSVIIDASPLLPVADTLALLPFADAVALCIRSGQTTDEVADLAKTALQHPPDAAPVGVVVTGLSLHAHSYDGYVYTTRVVKSAPR